MRHTRAHTRNRRAHHGLSDPGLVSCTKCKQPSLPHRACPNCGTYRGRQVIDVAARSAKKAASRKARADAGKASADASAK